MNPEEKERLELAASLESIEVFQRDVEPVIVRARDQLLTRDNYRAYSMNDTISRMTLGQECLYTMVSRTYRFDERDPARVRAVFDAALAPLGFECRQDAYEGEGGTTDTVLAWTSERYGVTVHFLVSQSWLTSFNYYTGELRSDGSGADPTVLADLPDRVPAWFAAVRSSAGSS